MTYVYYKKSDAEMLNLPILLKSYIVYFFYDVEVFVWDKKKTNKCRRNCLFYKKRQFVALKKPDRKMITKIVTFRIQDWLLSCDEEDTGLIFLK